MNVVDAGVVVRALLLDGAEGDLLRDRVAGSVAPEVLDIEVLSALRGLVRGGKASAEGALSATLDLRDLPVERLSHRPLLARCWDLRDNLTAYDAAYVALAELWQTTLVTTDARLARATGPRCEIELVGVDSR